ARLFVPDLIVHFLADDAAPEVVALPIPTAEAGFDVHRGRREGDEIDPLNGFVVATTIDQLVKSDWDFHGIFCCRILSLLFQLIELFFVVIKLRGIRELLVKFLRWTDNDNIPCLLVFLKPGALNGAEAIPAGDKDTIGETLTAIPLIEKLV